MENFKLYINGEWVESLSSKLLDDMNPATGEIFAQVSMAGEAEVEAAISAAVKAQAEWEKTTVREREAILLKAADYMEKNAERFAEWMIDESGSTHMKVMGEIGDTANMIRTAAAAAKGENGGVIQGDSPNQLSYYVRRPIGVVGGIAPYNYPLFLAIDKVAYAIAMGNAFILKPASYTPVSGLVIAECFHEAGLPAGVLNVLVGSGSVVGDALVEDPRVKMIAFTGSSAVGCEIAKRASAHLKRYSLEMGGKNPLILLKDYDVEKAAEKAIIGAYFHSGQICMASNKIIVEKPVYEEFCRVFSEKVQQLEVGDPHNPAIMVGPLIHEKQCAVLDRHIENATKKGAKLLCGGEHSGAFYKPSLLVDVTPEMEVFFEESFGPLTSVICAEDVEEIVELANKGDYGLSSAVLTNDVNMAMKLAERIDAGMVHINDSTVVGSTRAPFGGVKKSGVGREGLVSTEEYTEMKWITVQYE